MSRRSRLAIIGAAGLAIATIAASAWDHLALKRFAVVEPGRIYRGAWQRPWPLRRLIAREGIRTVVTLTAINRDDPKYVAQAAALEGTGADWIVIPMRGSRATIEQMREVADLIADPARQPVFFHCVGGHHRSNLVHGAYRIRQQGRSADEAWDEVAALPWSRPDRDIEDRLRIGDFARRHAQEDPPHEVVAHSMGITGLAAILAMGIGFLAVRWGTGNFGTVEPGKVYRSAQLSPDGLAGRIREQGVRTVLNLRGQNPDQPWYQGEVRATLAEDATQVDFPMSSDQWLSREQAAALLVVLKSSPKPILIHCEWGAERTGLVSAIWELLREGSTMADARRQFSTYYLFAPLEDGLVMRGHLDAYQAWLDREHVAHTPARFEKWFTSDYRPGSPSREHWPCNPYPIKVVTEPDAKAVVSWGEKVCR